MPPPPAPPVSVLTGFDCGRALIPCCKNSRITSHFCHFSNDTLAHDRIQRPKLILQTTVSFDMVGKLF